jgi:hypothetical protein
MTLSSRIYSRMLAFYPDDLRRNFAADMASVFAEDLAAARRESGIRGALRVWRWTAFEFLRLALPSWIATPAVRVRAISIALFAAMMLAILPVGLHSRFYSFRFALLLPLFSTPLIFAASLFACHETRLDRLQENPPCSKSVI